MKNCKKLHPFKWFILENYPFLEDSIDVLTNYQLFCKLGEMYNKQVEVINALGVQVEDITEWFNNLDVQEEINNKLDDMAESGELEEIIASYLNVSSLICFNTVSDMQEATNLIDGSFAKTFGFYSVNDGGGATYKIRTVTNDDNIDNSLLIPITSTEDLIAELIVVNNEINLLQVGAKNDESEDIGELVNYLINEKNYKVYAPAGSYLVTTTIRPERRKTLKFDGNLVYTGSDVCIEITNQDLILTTKRIISTDGVCCRFKCSSSTLACANNIVNFDDTLITENNNALEFIATLGGIIYNEIHFRTIAGGTSNYGVYMKTDKTNNSNGYINENALTGGTITRGLYGLYLDASLTTTASASQINGWKFNQISYEGVTNGMYLNGASGNKFNVPRVGELSASNKTITIVGICDRNIFEILSNMEARRIDISGITSGNNIIECFIQTTGGSKFGRDFITQGTHLEIRELLNRFEYLNVTNGAVTTGDPDNTLTYGADDYQNYLLINTTLNPVITLNQYFGSKGINEIFVTAYASNPFKLVDSFGTVVHDYSSPTSGLGTAHFICYNQSGSDKWKKV